MSRFHGFAVPDTGYRITGLNPKIPSQRQKRLSEDGHLVALRLTAIAFEEDRISISSACDIIQR